MGFARGNGAWIDRFSLVLRTAARSTRVAAGAVTVAEAAAAMRSRQAEATSPKPGAAPARNVAEALRVLVVDDDLTMLAVCRAALRDLVPDARIDTARSGEEALLRLRNGPFDLVLADQHMSRATGIDVLETARKESPQALRVLMTGDPHLEMAQEALDRARIHAYIVKGSAKGVKETIARLLREERHKP